MKNSTLVVAVVTSLGLLCGCDPSVEGDAAEEVLESPADLEQVSELDRAARPTDPVYREVDGWPGYVCADLGQLVDGSDALTSNWYRAESGPGLALDRDGSCASFATDVEKARYGDVPGWPGYKCATLPGALESMWFTVGSGVRSARKFPGSCASFMRSPGFSAYRTVQGWAEWLCADSDSGSGQSMWYRLGAQPSTTSPFSGTCDSYIR